MSNTDFKMSVKAIDHDAPRREPGDVSELRQSIEEIGLQHPVLITEDARVLSGSRRLRACRQLGWKEVQVKVVDSVPAAAAALEAERDGDCERAMKTSEQARQGLRLEALGRKERLERFRVVVKGKGSRPVKSGWSLATIADAVGFRNETRYRRAKTIVKWAEDESATQDVRENALLGLKTMDEQGRVDSAYEQLQFVRNDRPPKKRPKPSGPDGTYTDKQTNDAKSEHDKVWKSLRTLDVISRELPKLRFHMVPVIADEKEVQEMIDLYDRSVENLASFRRALQERLSV